MKLPSWVPQLFISILIITLLGVMRIPVQATSDPRFYDMGTPTLQTIWVDATAGNDTNNGTSRTSAKRSVSAVWNSIPANTTLTTGYQIMLVSGVYDSTRMPNYWENRRGTAQFPIIIRSADGAGAATITRDLNIYNVSYLYLIDLAIVPAGGGDVVHCERCNYFFIKNSTLNGGPSREAHETLKVNQSQYVYLEHNNISGAADNNIDFVAVQYGHIQSNVIHDAGDWCMYTKGGSANIRIEGNEIYDCAVGGYVAGQGTGFEYMVTPWLHYEAYDIKFINNVIHDTLGAGMGVNGGYNILLAYNTLYDVGRNSHGLEVVFGWRSCDGDPSAATSCSANLALNGWGTTTIGVEGEPIPNRNVFIFNNILYNPPGVQSEWQHFAIHGPRTPNGGTNILSPSRSDTNLQIKGNIIWNGPANLSLGLGDNQGCLPSNPTCNATQLLADNRINTLQPQLNNPSGGDFRPNPTGNLVSITSVAIPDFPDDRPLDPLAPFDPLVPLGDLFNQIGRDINNTARQPGIPGAFAVADNSSATNTPLATPTFSRTATQTRTLTNTRTNTQTRTLTNTRTNTRTRTDTATPTISKTPTVSRTPTNTPTASNTRTNTNTRTSTKTPTNSNTPTNSKTPTMSRTSTNTPTASNTRTPTNTRTATKTPTNSNTPTNSKTPTMSRTSTNTPTASNTRTNTPTRTATKTPTNSNTPTNSKTPTMSRTRTTTPTPTNTRTETNTRTITNTRTATNTRTSTRTVTVTPTSSVTPVSVAQMPIVPVIDSASKATLRAIYLSGQALGNRAGVFAKVGDSITSSGSFLTDIGCQSEDLGNYSSLASTISFFRATTFPLAYGTAWCGDSNSFNAYSVSADSGWSADYALAVLNPLPSGCAAPNNTALLCELKRKKPSIVLIMYGTNDLERYNDVNAFRTQLTSIVQKSVAAGVIPVLSTIPARTDSYAGRVASYNAAIIAVAQSTGSPLWNYWLALQSAGVINQGISADGIHPSIYMNELGADFTITGLRYGYNQRNLTAVQVLEAIKRIVIDDGAPDS